MYLVPGMAHCGGGPALDRFDMLGAVVNWVEQGTPPDAVIATGKAFPVGAIRSAPIPNMPSTRAAATARVLGIFGCQ